MVGDEATEVIGARSCGSWTKFELYYEHTVGSHVGVSIMGGEFIGF